MIKNFVLVAIVMTFMAANVMAGHRHVVKHRQGRHGTSTRVYSSSNYGTSARASYRVSTGFAPVRVQVRSSGCPGGNCP